MVCTCGKLPMRIKWLNINIKNANKNASHVAKAFFEITQDLDKHPLINITTESGIRKEISSAIWDLGGACRIHTS